MFEKFIKTCLDYHNLHPYYYFSAPGLTFDTMLKMTGVKLQTISDINVHLFIEKCMRSSISNICKRYALATNKYLKHYDRNKVSTFIMYWDVNNLYGWAMNQPLPISDFDFLTKKEIKNFDLSSVSENSSIGYILEVDFVYPDRLHVIHSDYPLAPEKIEISSAMLSEYCSHIAYKYGINVGGVKKLVPNLGDKVKYIVHYRNLQYYLSLGMKLIKIHRISKFRQSNWLKEYTEYTEKNRSKRQIWLKFL